MSPRTSIAPLLELDQDLTVAPRAHVDGRLDAAAGDEAGLARLDGTFDVVLVGTGGVRLEARRDPIALDLHEHVVVVVPVRRRLGAGGEIQLPDPHLVVFEQDSRCDVAEDPHGCSLQYPAARSTMPVSGSPARERRRLSTNASSSTSAAPGMCNDSCGLRRTLGWV